jgi:predicted NUDIX family NTP pyrophosphohydrolase
MKSAGILAFKLRNKELLVFLVHPGGPFWKNKDAGAWSIPKGEFTDEDPLQAAIREFKEETGIFIEGKFFPLAPVTLKSKKTIYGFAVEFDLNAETIKSNLFEMEWPPRSGKFQSFPEIDKGAWFNMTEAKDKINPGQISMLEELEFTILKKNK